MSGKETSGKVIKAGAGYVIGNYMLKGVTFLSVPIFSRLLAPDEYGRFNVYVSYEAIFTILVGMALHSSINSAKFKYREKLEEYISSVVLLAVGSTVLWMAAAYFLYDAYAGIIKFSRGIVLILAFHCLASELWQIYNVYVGLSYRYQSFLKISAVNALSNILLSVVLILTVCSDNRITGRIMGTVVPLGLIGLYIIIYFWRKAKPRIVKEYYQFGLGYSLPIVPHGISQVILSTFDRIMIEDMVGGTEAGIYSFAYTIYQIFMVASTSLHNVWKPWMFEKMENKEHKEIREKGSAYALGMAVFTILILLVSPEMIKILGPEAYWNSVGCVVPVLIGGYFSFLYSLPSLVEYYYGKTKFIAMGTMLAAVVNVVLNYIFIAKYGYIAAAYTTLVTYVLYFLLHYFLAKKIHGTSLFSWKQLVLISGAVFVGGIATIVFSQLLLVRWGIAICVFGGGVLWAERQFGLVRIVKDKLKK